jgi:small subunit ribosomal protein S20
MANTKSAEKRILQSEKKRLRNRSNRSRLRTAVKKLRDAVERGDAATATALLPETLKVVDESAGKGALHRNAADRTKSRLTRAVGKLSQPAASA